MCDILVRETISCYELLFCRGRTVGAIYLERLLAEPSVRRPSVRRGTPEDNVAETLSERTKRVFFQVVSFSTVSCNTIGAPTSVGSENGFYRDTPDYYRVKPALAGKGETIL